MTLKLKTETFIERLREIIQKDELLTKVKQWPKNLECFTEFTYIDDKGDKITLINDCERVD